MRHEPPSPAQKSVLNLPKILGRYLPKIPCTTCTENRAQVVRQSHRHKKYGE